MKSISIKSRTRTELIDITGQIQQAIASADASDGLAFIYVPHTTAGLTINEGADPDVKTDIIKGFKEFVPIDYPFKHMEGNSPSHIMASLMGASLTILISDGRLQLGTWQALYFCEFDGPRNRTIQYRITT